MSKSISGSELIDIAIAQERRGIAFYDVLSRSIENNAARYVLQQLADMERDHIQIFQGMRSESDRFAVENYSAERIAYLQSLVDNAVFTDDMINSEMVTQIGGGIAALELAMAAEKDSILFYYEMKEAVLPPAQSVLNKVIAEEKSHLKQLSELKRRLAAGTAS
jgi:rubrerythrin